MVYIQSDSERKLPSHFDAACALYGALDNAQDIRLTSFEEVQSGKFDALIRNHLFVGSVEFMTEVFSRVGKSIPSMENPYQEKEIMKLSEVKDKITERAKWFVKPTKTKLFTGMVFDSMTLSQLNAYPDDTMVIVAAPFKSKIVSETRCYVRFNKIVDARNYSGDFRISSDFIWADEIVRTLYDYPSAFTMDIGVLESGENVVIEFNDMWAIGNYGMDNSDYYKLLRERYFEIIRSK